jgi:hypothetical protein
MAQGPPYGAGIELLISASPGDWHLVEVAELTQYCWVDGWSVPPPVDAAAAVGAAAIATATAPAASTGVMCFNPIRMVGTPFDSQSIANFVSSFPQMRSTERRVYKSSGEVSAARSAGGVEDAPQIGELLG